MDPSACLDEAESALDDGDIERACEALDAYCTWRDGGGFAPPNGTQRYYELTARLPTRDDGWGDASAMVDGYDD